MKSEITIDFISRRISKETSKAKTISLFKQRAKLFDRQFFDSLFG